MQEVTTLFDSDRAEYEYMQERFAVQKEQTMKEQIEKQAIEEMATFLWKNTLIHTEDLCHDVAETLYNAGYRKQGEGEWIRQEKKNGRVSPEAVCSNCGRDVEYQVIDGKWSFENYCSHCGAKMKGGAE